ncbi:MAG: hypothetical protein ACC652_12445 [Acidimicrobiales bacterium]
MTIRYGEKWGKPISIPEDTPVATTDREVASLYSQGHSVIRLDGGDVHRVFGQPARRADCDLWGFPMDVAWFDSDLGRQVFVAHLLVGMRRGIPEIALMNSGFYGEWELAPRGHINDGRLEVVSLSIPRADRREFRRRVVSGSHVPHPGIEIRSVKKWQGSAHGKVLVDGVALRLHGDLSVEIEPDALTIVV